MMACLCWHGYTNSGDGDVNSNHSTNTADIWIVKTDTSGNIIWKYNYGGTGSDVAYSIALTSDNGFIVGGKSSSADGDVTENNGEADFWIIKLNSNGVMQWQKSFGGSDADECYTIIQTAEGGYICLLYTSPSPRD